MHGGPSPHPLPAKERGEGVKRYAGRPADTGPAVRSLSPFFTYRIHTSQSLRVVPCLMRRKSSKPRRITFGPGLP
jgi:hypothetical protein